MTTDEEAEAFLEQDLSDLDFSQFKQVRFEFEEKAARVNMRMSQSLLGAVKKHAAARGIPYQRLIREVLEKAVTAADSNLSDTSAEGSDLPAWSARPGWWAAGAPREGGSFAGSV